MATLYRKYRSRTFAEVIGQDPIVTTLTNQIKLGRVGHAYLFTGSRGIGKTSCARIFARAVNCLHPVDGNPCGECEACRALAADSVDIVEMDAASNNGVDDARDIREKVKYAPVSCKYKVYIIDEVHMLTGGAFNALLKTIEEPPEHVIFILATTEPQKLPQTILSRCIRFDFKLVPTDILAKHVARIYDAEGVKYTPEAVEEIARLGEGSVRDALSVADTLASAAEKVTHDVVLALTGAGDAIGVAALFDCVARRDVAGALSAVDEFARNGKSVAAVCGQLVTYARNVLVAKAVGCGKAVERGLVNAGGDEVKRIEASAEALTVPAISRILEHFSAAENGLKYSVNPRVYLETAIVKLICGADREDEILRRIAALEKNSVAPTEQKKNNDGQIACAPPPTLTEKTAVAKNIPAAQSDYEPEPPPEVFNAPEIPQSRNRTVFTKQPEPPREQFYPSDVPPSRRNTAFPKQPEPLPQSRSEREARAEIKSADEGEFKHIGATRVTGYALFGKIVTALRRRNTAKSERARDLLSRGVKIKERDDAVAFIAPDDCFLSLTESGVVNELNAAIAACGLSKLARIERTDESLLADDVERAKVLFSKFGVI